MVPLRYLAVEGHCRAGLADVVPGYAHWLTTRNRLSAVGQAIDDELRAEIADAKPTAAPAETMVVGIDGCYIKGIHKARKSSIEVVLGRVESRGRPSEVFAVVRKLDDLAKERVSGRGQRRCQSHADGGP